LFESFDQKQFIKTTPDGLRWGENIGPVTYVTKFKHYFSHRQIQCVLRYLSVIHTWYYAQTLFCLLSHCIPIRANCVTPILPTFRLRNILPTLSQTNQKLNYIHQCINTYLHMHSCTYFGSVRSMTSFHQNVVLYWWTLTFFTRRKLKIVYNKIRIITTTVK
jgi:hypothetical protein